MQVNDNGCPFCNEFNGHQERSYFAVMFGSKYGIKQRCIFETEHFACVPSIGSFVEGYLLVIPKQHFLSSLVIPASYTPELLSILSRISVFYDKAYHKGMILYEHGTADAQKAGGMSVVHAHLHFVPCSQPVVTKCSEFSFMRFPSFSEAAKYYSMNQNSPYLLLRDVDGSFYFSTSDEIPSQYFRKRVCDLCGIPGTGDWKEYPYVGHIKKTLAAAKRFDFNDVSRGE